MFVAHSYLLNDKRKELYVYQYIPLSKRGELALFMDNHLDSWGIIRAKLNADIRVLGKLSYFRHQVLSDRKVIKLD